MKTYERAPQEVEERAARIIGTTHKELQEVGLTVDFLFARNDEGDAVTDKGYPAVAVVKIVPLKDRAAGRRDAEIVIDAVAWEQMTEAQKDALLDHELLHLIVRRTDDNSYDYDDLSRPKLKMRLHDIQAGWFLEIAQRHGEASPEVMQAKHIYARHPELFEPDIMQRIDEALAKK